MNVSPINTSTVAISQLSPIKEITKPHQFPREIAIRLRTLNLLAEKIVGQTAPSFCKIAYYLDQPNESISFDECERLFQEACIVEFSADQVDLFLEHFFNEFDPDGYFINYKGIQNKEAKSFLWENCIGYFCSQYVGFQTPNLSIENIFNSFKENFDTDGTIIKVPPSEYRTQLEQNFDHVISVIPNFSTDEMIQLQLLLVSHAALLTSNLKEVEEQFDPNLMLETGFSIQDLFEEIIFLLLELPFVPIEMTPSKMIYHEKLDSLDPIALKKKFLNDLVDYLVDPQDPLYEQSSSAVYEVMGSCYLLDFEIKKILGNISGDETKKTSN